MLRTLAISRTLVLVTAVSLTVLSACGGSGDDHGDDHDEESIDTAGRLITIEKDARTVRVHDLDGASAAVEGTHQADQVPSALYASPQARYAVVMQRTQDLVQFVDGGIWQEDHGDHLHDYRQASRLAGWKLSGARPTHYDVQTGKQAAIFMDGNSSAVPVQNAAVRLIDDASIGSGRVLASLDLAAPIHGLGEPVDNKLLTVSRASDAPDALPTHLALHLRSGNGYVLDRQLPTRCDGMHGSFSSGVHTVAGCIDGMLLVRHLGASTVDDGRKLATAFRVGTVLGHPLLPDHFIGIATDGTAPAPVTTRFYAVDAAAAAVTEIVPQGWTTGRVSRAHGFDRSGQRFYVLDDQGTLIAMQRQSGTWTSLSRMAAVVPTMPTAAPWPVFTTNRARNEIYLTDPTARQLIVMDSSSGAVLSRRDLGYVPTGAAWVGIPR